jgi:hypothetical protein
LTRHKALCAAVAVAAAAIAAFAAPSAGAFGGVNHDYACYSATGAPILAAANDTGVFATSDTFAPGYFAPMAESSVPTQTPIPGGWYLTCSLQTGWTQIGSYILGDGSTIAMNGPTSYLQNSLPIPGVYPVIQSATPAS